MNFETKNKKAIVFIIIAFIVGVVGASIAFATTSTLLTIGEGDNQAVMDPISWKVKFDTTYDIETNTTVAGSANVDLYPTYQADNLLSDFKVTLTRTGDAVTFKLKIDNTGNLDAKVDAVSLGAFTCNGVDSITGSADEAIVCDPDNMEMTLTYDGGSTPVAAWTSGTDNLLDAGSSVYVNLKIEYIGTTLPTNDVEISIGDTTVSYNEKS